MSGEDNLSSSRLVKGSVPDWTFSLSPRRSFKETQARSPRQNVLFPKFQRNAGEIPSSKCFATEVSKKRRRDSLVKMFCSRIFKETQARFPRQNVLLPKFQRNAGEIPSSKCFVTEFSKKRRRDSLEII